MKYDVEKLKQAREDRLLTIRELARMAGVSQSAVWQVESGQQWMKTVRKMAKALDMDLSDVVIKDRRRVS